MRRSPAILLAVVTLVAAPRAAFAATSLAAVDLGLGALGTNSARDVDAADRIYVQGPPTLDGGPSGMVLLPPHPGGGTLVLPCSVLLSCFHVLDVPGGLTASGRVLGRRVSFGSGGPFFPQPATWSASGLVTNLLSPLPGGYPFGGLLPDANANDVFVGGLLSPTLGVGVPVYWSSPTAAPVTLANLASNDGPHPLRISDGGEIIGNRMGSTPRAVRWSSVAAAAFVYLGELPGGVTSQAKDLDETSRIVGSSDAGGGVQRAVLWRPGGGGHTIESLPIPFAGGSCTEATAILPSGLIAGNCTKAGGERRGVIWRDSGGVVTFEHELLPVPGDAHSAVYALGGSSLAVGSSGSPERAVLWSVPVAPAADVPALGLPGLVLLATLLAAGALRTRRLAR